MGKQQSFWIGFFAASLLAVPVALGIMGVAEERLRQMAVALFAGVAVLVVLLVVALFFRDPILSWLLGRSKVALEDVAGSLVGAVSAASEGDRDKAAEHARALVQGGVGWYAWSSFYRWVIGSALGLLLAFGAFVGTVLLFEQTRTLRVQTDRIGEQTELMSAQTELMQAQTERLREQTEAAAMQNEIMTLSIVAELRAQLLNTVEEVTLSDIAADFPATDAPVVQPRDSEMDCGLKINSDYRLRTPPNRSTVGAIAALSQGMFLGERVRQALWFLLEDSDDAVAFGALQILDQIGEPIDIAGDADDPLMSGQRGFEGLFLDDIQLGAEHALRFFGVWIHSVDCPNCAVTVWNSVFGGDMSRKSLILSNTFVGSPNVGALSGARLLTFSQPEAAANGRNHQMDFRLDNQTLPIVLYNSHLDTSCRALRHFGDNNPFFTYDGPDPGLMAVPPDALIELPEGKN